VNKSGKAYTNLNDEELVKCISSGDKHALMVLYNKYYTRLVWFARTFIFDTHHAEDIVQDIFLRFIEEPNKFDTSLKFSTWIYTITANRCRNEIRNKKTRESLSSEIYQPLTTEINSTYDKQKITELLRNFIPQLKEKEKVLFVLRFEHHLPIKEIAQVTSIPEGTVKSGIFNLLRKLSIQLKDYRNEHHT